MSRSLMLLVTASVLSVAGAAPVPPAAEKPGLYYPTTVGTKWVYATNGGDVTYAVTGVEDKDGTKLVTVESVGEGVGIPTHTMQVSSKGLVGLSTSGVKYDPPHPYLVLPAKKGDTWDAGFELKKGEQYTGTMTVAGVEKVTVGAGTFEAIRIEWEWTFPNGGNGPERGTATFWYAPGVGRVKVTAGDTTTSLKSFTPGKK